ncbi:MAG: hypothetical protein R2875_11605 [Desulfobacterales bacterium]
MDPAHVPAMVVFLVTAVGSTHVCLRKVEAETVPTSSLVDEKNVTHLCAAPTVLIGLSTYAAEKNCD